MISVIICSINKALAAQVKRNIDETIGVPYELILIDNTAIGNGICSVYNEGARQAKYDLFCFVHEDVLFQTPNWGKIIAGYFEDDPGLGIAGVAGAKYKSRTLSGWSNGISKYDCCSILHIDKDKNQLKIYSNPDPGKKIQDVITVDGVFICASKKAWKMSPFNEDLLRGFHLYDIDFSFSIAKIFKVIVSYEIDIIHLTEGGDFGNNWVMETINWHKHNAGHLPLSNVSMTGAEVNKIEKIISKKWLHRLKGEKISIDKKINWLKLTQSYKHFSLWPHILVFLLFRLYKRKSK